jgi:hypothetical protein
MQACQRPLFAEIAYLLIAMEAANSTVNFCQASPPNYGRESPQIREARSKRKRTLDDLIGNFREVVTCSEKYLQRANAAVSTHRRPI